MDVDGGWDDYPPEDDRSSGNDAGDAMEVDAEVVREALRTLSAARGHAGNEDDPEGDVAWPGTWPGIWPGTRSETGSALVTSSRPLPGKICAAADFMMYSIENRSSDAIGRPGRAASSAAFERSRVWWRWWTPPSGGNPPEEEPKPPPSGGTPGRPAVSTSDRRVPRDDARCSR